MEFKGEQNLVMTELEWLIDHHLTKLEERIQMVEDLKLKPGSFVLDLGCGPGLWTNMIADNVKPNGKVIGMDFASCLIDYARENIQEENKNIIQFKRGDFNDTFPFENQTFDVVFFGNCLAYIEDYNKVFNEIKRVTKNGGRVVAKDFDGSVFIVNPIDPHLTLKILSANAHSLKEKPLDPKFDNFMGRKMQGLFKSAGFKNVSTKSYAIQKYHPLSPEAKRYITGNAEWYVNIGSQYLSKEDIQLWKSYFDVDSKNYVLDNEEFYFCMLEVFTSGNI